MKLFIPGPTEVRKDVLAEMARPVIGHRSSSFSSLYNKITSQLREYFDTENFVMISTSSATGLMEGAVRNFCSNKCLNLTCGAFSEKWHQITKNNGKQCEALAAEWGKVTHSDNIQERLQQAKFDTLTLVHNETSTGVMNPLESISKVLKKHNETMFAVDTVSSAGGVPLYPEKLKIDFMLFSVQKCFALPPGLSISIVSEQAIEKAKTVPHRGHYFDIVEFVKKAEKGQTPSTPSISHMYALHKQLEIMLEEGKKRFKRHEEMSTLVQDFAHKHFEMFAEPDFESKTVTCITNNRNIDVSELNKELELRGKTISNGYGKLKDKTFRIAHMGELQVEDIKEVLEDIEEILEL